VHVVSRLDSHGYGRLPVIDRKSGTLAGIITKGDIIERLLHKIEVDYQEEEIRRYRASHFFEDIVADSTRLSFLYEIRGKSIAEGGGVASSLKKTLKRLGIHPEVVRRASIAMYEAEMNVIIYAREGQVAVSVDQNRIYVEVEDEGPGIVDVEKALQPGFSTAPEWVRELGFGAGMGLSNIEKCAEDMQISSVVGEGTLLKLSFTMEQP
jgi:anti-sigma regulatory factor (Ser/Thr protein kinase)